MTEIVDIALEYIDCINHRKTERLAELLSKDARSVNERGEVSQDGKAIARGIEGYWTNWPEFTIHVNDVYVVDGTVHITNRTTRSCAEKPRSLEIRDPSILKSLAIADGHVTEFALHNDTPEVRRHLGLTAANRYTNPC